MNEAARHPLASVNGLAVVMAFLECPLPENAWPRLERKYWVIRRALDNSAWIWSISGGEKTA